MQHFNKKFPFTHFLRKWSEQVRTTLLSNLEDLKLGLFPAIPAGHKHNRMNMIRQDGQD